MSARRPTSEFLTSAALGCLMGLTLTSAPALAAPQEIKLTVLSGYSAKASWVRVFKGYWMPEVNKRLAKSGKYKINFNEAFGTVVKPRGEFEATRQGLGDIGLVVSVFHADKVPLTSVSFVTPFVTTDLELNARVYDKLTYKFPKMLGNWDKFNMKFLGHMGVIKSYVLMSRKPIKTIADVKGIKVVGAGLNLRWLEGLGATGIPSALTKFYNQAQTGVADAMIVWPDAVRAFKLCEVAPYMLRADLGGVTSFAVAVNKRAWAKLPKEVQDVMSAVTPDYRDELARQTSDGHAKGLEACKAQGGTITVLDKAERDKWAKILPPIAKQWAQAADKQGLPGTAVLKAYMDEMRAAKQPIARHWDRD